MKRRGALAISAMLLLMSTWVGAAYAEGVVTVVIPPGPPGVIQASTNGVACGSAIVSAMLPATMTLSPTCAIPGARISFASGTTALASSVIVPGTGSGKLTLADLTAAQPVTIILPSGRGSLDITVDGQACGTAVLGLTATSMTLPATCTTPYGTIGFKTGAGVPLATTLSIPASGGGTISLNALNITSSFTSMPIYGSLGAAMVVFPAGSPDQLEAAAISAGATAAWVQDASGTYRGLIVGGPSWLNDGFRATFAGGFSIPTAITLTR